MKDKRAFTIVELAMVIGVFLLMMAVLAPFVNMAKERKNKIACAGNLMKISIALHSYASEHGGAFPPSLGELYPRYISDEKAFDCPASKRNGAITEPDYLYTAGLTELSSPKEILAQDAEGNHKKSGRNVLRLNGLME
jgi:competence protein ComGC